MDPTDIKLSTTVTRWKQRSRSPLSGLERGWDYQTPECHGKTRGMTCLNHGEVAVDSCRWNHDLIHFFGSWCVKKETKEKGHATTCHPCFFKGFFNKNHYCPLIIPQWGRNVVQGTRVALDRWPFRVNYSDPKNTSFGNHKWGWFSKGNGTPYFREMGKVGEILFHLARFYCWKGV